MIFTDESGVKVDGVLLPGLFKSIEVKEAAVVDEQEVEGQTKKPKQATGYEDGKVVIELTLEDGPELTKTEKLEMIRHVFREPGQEKPTVHNIVNEHTAVRGISRVIFKELTHKMENKKSQIVAVLEFWEYTVINVKAVGIREGSGGSAGPGAPAAQTQLKDDYAQYLPGRGKSPAQDTADPSRYLDMIGDMPY